MENQQLAIPMNQTWKAPILKLALINRGLVPNEKLALMQEQAESWNNSLLSHKVVKNETSINHEKYLLKNYNVSYDGKTSVHNFIQRVEELLKSRKTPEHILVSCFPDLLKGNASVWFRLANDEFKDWAQLKKALYVQFESVHVISELMNTIQLTKQGSDELVSDYILKIRAMASRLSNRMTIEEALIIIQQGLLPRYQNFVMTSNVQNYSQLIDSCRKVDLIIGPKVTPNTSKNSNEFKSNIAVVNNQEVANGSGRANYIIKCLKCLEEGHHFTSCNKIKYPICFVCRKTHTTSKNCPDCLAKGITKIQTYSKNDQRATGSNHP